MNTYIIDGIKYAATSANQAKMAHDKRKAKTPAVYKFGAHINTARRTTYHAGTDAPQGGA